MNDRRGRKVHVVEIDGRTHNAYATSITFSVTLDDLMHAIAVAATTRSSNDGGFDGALSHNPVARESYWSEQEIDEAEAAASALGPGHIYAAARDQLRAHGEAWRSDAWDEAFPAEVARRRARELFPMLDDENNPFAPPPDVQDR
jgi:hypothetical protein